MRKLVVEERDREREKGRGKASYNGRETRQTATC